jgi:hypothetical protein
MTTSPPPPAPVTPGSRTEIAGLLLRSLLDVLSMPFHIVGFLFTRRRQRERFRAALRETSLLTPDGVERAS